MSGCGLARGKSTHLNRFNPIQSLSGRAVVIRLITIASAYELGIGTSVCGIRAFSGWGLQQYSKSLEHSPPIAIQYSLMGLLRWEIAILN